MLLQECCQGLMLFLCVAGVILRETKVPRRFAGACEERSNDGFARQDFLFELIHREAVGSRVRKSVISEVVPSVYPLLQNLIPLLLTDVVHSFPDHKADRWNVM